MTQRKKFPIVGEKLWFLFNRYEEDGDIEAPWQGIVTEISEEDNKFTVETINGYLDEFTMKYPYTDYWRKKRDAKQFFRKCLQAQIEALDHKIELIRKRIETFS